ncbi:hypothetical protein [Frankia sp. AgW1.1]|uniref:nSTAND1 domain-containing NTPase n=1 Tax=Frankia sp. AgW1.1 TaxID=1836971 RepID=UPI0019317C65|nr:hypothetical protein [Frankia sp. AgW1.1]MBL7493162.1 hypothetical protein [Frankia sp. AgW1.1]
MQQPLDPTGLPADSQALIICPGRPPEPGAAQVVATALRGADALRRSLTGPGALAENRVQLVDQPRTAVDVAMALTLAGTVPRDVLLVCWLGPVAPPDGGEPLLVVGTEPDAERSGTLRFGQLLALTAASPARRRVVLVDGWRLGSDSSVTARPEEDLAAGFAEVAGRYGDELELLVAVSPGEQGFAAGPLPPAVASVDQLLMAGDPDGPEQLTVGGLFATAHRRLAAAGVVSATHLAGPATSETPLARNLARVTRTDAGRVEATVLLADPSPAGPVPAAAELAPTASPYPGLAAFDAGSERYFFGRSETVAEVLAALRDRPADAGPLVLVGASGAGKSSVLRAGVLPALRRGELGRAVAAGPQVLLTPTERPLDELAARVAEAIAPPGLAGVIRDAVRTDPGRLAQIVGDLVARAVDPYDPAVTTPAGPADSVEPTAEPPRARLVVAVDQFEETFTLAGDTLAGDEAQRAGFVAALAALAAPGPAGEPAPAVVLLAVRGDFYLRCVGYPELAHALARGQVVVGPMRRDEIRAAVVRPATAVGLTVSPALVELILDDLAADEDAGDAGSGSLPLLAHALRATWERRAAGTLTVDAYRAVGRLGGALAKTAASWSTGRDAAGQETAQGLLLGLVRVGEVGEATRRPRPRAALLSEVPAPGAPGVLDALIRGRLVEADENRVQLTHEALVRAWPRLREWVELDRAGALVRQRLDDGGQEWESHGRDPSLLIRGQRLTSARDWVEAGGRRRTLASPAAEFYDASVDRERAEAEQARRRTRRLRSLVAALTVLVLVATGTSVFAFNRRAAARTAESAAVTANATALSAHIAGVAETVAANNSEVAAQLAIAADRTADTPDAKTAILGASSPVRLLHAHDGSIGTVAWSPNGRVVASGSDDGMVKLWDVTHLPAVHPLGAALRQGDAKSTHAVKAVTFDDTGRLLAVGTANGDVKIYTVTSPAAPVLRDTLPTAPLDGGGVFALAFSAHGDVLAVGGYGGSAVRLYDVGAPGAPRLLSTLNGSAEQVRSLAFNPDGTLLVTGSEDGYAYLWDVTDAASPLQLQTLATPPAATAATSDIRAVAFSPTGRELAVGTSYDDVLRFTVDGKTATPATTLAANNTEVSSLGYVDGQTLGVVEAGAGVGLSLFRPGEFSYLVPTPTSKNDVAAFYTLPQPSTPWSFAADPLDDHWIVTSGSDGALRWARWNDGIAAGGEVPQFLFPRSNTSIALVTSLDTLEIYDFTPDPGHLPAPTLRAAADLTAGSAYAPFAGDLAARSGLLAVAASDQVTLWDVSDAAIARWPSRTRGDPPAKVAPLASIPRTAGTTTDVALSPDGRRLAIGTPGGLELWDITTRTAPKLLGRQPTAHKSTGLVRVAFSPDSRWLASTSNDKVLKIWDVGHRLAGGPTGTLTLPAGQNAVAFSPKGATVALGGQDNRVRLVDVADPVRPRVAGTSTSQAFQVLAVIFSPDGRQLVAGGAEDIRVWDVTNPADPRWTLSLPAIRGLNYPFTFASFLGGGRYLVVGRNYAVGSLYDLDIGQDLSRLCAGLGDVITREEWDTYLNGVPYARPCGAT